MVLFNPKLAPEVINMMLLGPGVIEDTKEKLAKASITSKDKMDSIFFYGIF